MKVILRADAGGLRGTGHVMRCLTVAEALRSQGHTVALMGDIGGIDWLTEYLRASGVTHLPVARDELEPSRVAALEADRVVVDSYWIDADRISQLDILIPTMAIIDNETRGIRATWFVDHNLGAEKRDWSGAGGRVLAGSRFALVREAMLRHRTESGWDIPGRESHVVAFMGGSDPSDAMTTVAMSIAATLPNLHFTAITTTTQIAAVESAVADMPNATVWGPRLDLPELLGTADAVVSAAGTSAWDVCSMGRPVVLVAVVDNQSAGLAQALREDIATGIDLAKQEPTMVGALVADLLDDANGRQRRVERANKMFDGGGSQRVAAELASVPPLGR